jgi:predicted nucleic acid-binding Zn ribbon protein
MPEYIDPSWEYRQDDPEILEAMGAKTVLDEWEGVHGISRSTTPWQATRLQYYRARPEAKTGRSTPTCDPIRYCEECSKPLLPERSGVTCSTKCRNKVGRRVHVAMATRRAVMVSELLRVYGTLKRAAAEARMNHPAASRALKRVGIPAGYTWRSRMQNQDSASSMFAGLVYSIDHAKFMISAGVKFGDVYPGVDESDREELRRWFVEDLDVVNLRGLRSLGSPTQQILDTREMGYTGDICAYCGGCKMTRSGSCQKCEDCGETGGCS